MFIDLLLCIVGLVLLVYCADKLVEGASNLALNFGVSKLVIGLTIVAAGTSLPEFVVSLNSSIKGNPALSLGNVVGSNIMNIALILGITALIKPISCTKAMVKRDVPIMIIVTGLVWYMAHTDAILTPNEALILIALFVAYNIMNYKIGKKEGEAEASNTPENPEEEEKLPSTWFNVLCIVGGLIGLVLGSECLVRGSVSIAKYFGVSDEIIGLTLVAIGTSLPELATSIVAARKGQSDLAIGNVVGSNIFNLLAIVGTAAVVPMFMNGVTTEQYLLVSNDMLGLHIPIMMVVAIVLLPIMFTDMMITKKEGAFYVIVYIAYTVMLIQTTVATSKANKEEQKPITEESQVMQQQNPITLPSK